MAVSAVIINVELSGRTASADANVAAAVDGRCNTIINAKLHLVVAVGVLNTANVSIAAVDKIDVALDRCAKQIDMPVLPLLSRIRSSAFALTLVRLASLVRMWTVPKGWFHRCRHSHCLIDGDSRGISVVVDASAETLVYLILQAVP